MSLRPEVCAVSPHLLSASMMMPLQICFYKKDDNISTARGMRCQPPLAQCAYDATASRPIRIHKRIHRRIFQSHALTPDVSFGDTQSRPDTNARAWLRAAACARAWLRAAPAPPPPPPPLPPSPPPLPSSTPPPAPSHGTAAVHADGRRSRRGRRRRGRRYYSSSSSSYSAHLRVYIGVTGGRTCCVSCRN
jgi:hypothetical protein